MPLLPIRASHGGRATSPNTAGKVILGVCAMDKKTRSQPMTEILSRLPPHEFETRIFGDEVILGKPVEEWPLCDALICFYSGGFPLAKAEKYYNLRRPFLINDITSQRMLWDRRVVYTTLQRYGVPVPRHVFCNRDGWPHTGDEDTETGRSPDTVLEEFDDFIVLDGVRIKKPFVEKPVDGDDHNVYIYYSRSSGGGRKRLFRKIGNKSSEFDADVSAVRRTGSYIYEQFLPTEGTDVKVYAVGPYYGHAEARKSPVVDGVVQRDQNGKEVRHPVMLNSFEKKMLTKIVLAFQQRVCGFDYLRSNGRTYVCDVNGWSFVKTSTAYYDDCSLLLRRIVREALGMSLNSVFRPMLLDSRPRNKDRSSGSSVGSGGRGGVASSSSLRVPVKPRATSSGGSTTKAVVVAGAGAGGAGKATIVRHNSHDSTAARSTRKPRRAGDELRCVVAVVRHADRSPKQKLKMKVTHELFLDLFEKYGFYDEALNGEAESPSVGPLVNPLDPTGQSGARRRKKRGIAAVGKDGTARDGKKSKELKLKTGKQLAQILSITRSLLAVNADDSDSDAEEGEPVHKLEQIRAVLEMHGGFKGITRKIQLKPLKWARVRATSGPAGGASSGFSPPAASWVDGTGTSVAAETRLVVVEALLILKWGGKLTAAGRAQAEKFGHDFRREMYPGVDGLLRLHNTFRHDLKIYSSDEGRVQVTAAAFTKGFLDLEGHLTPILASLVRKSKESNLLLDDSSRASEQLAACKTRLHSAMLAGKGTFRDAGARPAAATAGARTSSVSSSGADPPSSPGQQSTAIEATEPSGYPSALRGCLSTAMSNSLAALHDNPFVEMRRLHQLMKAMTKQLGKMVKAAAARRKLKRDKKATSGERRMSPHSPPKSGGKVLVTSPIAFRVDLEHGADMSGAHTGSNGRGRDGPGPGPGLGLGLGLGMAGAEESKTEEEEAAEEQRRRNTDSAWEETTEPVNESVGMGKAEPDEDDDDDDDDEEEEGEVPPETATAAGAQAPAVLGVSVTPPSGALAAIATTSQDGSVSPTASLSKSGFVSSVTTASGAAASSSASSTTATATTTTTTTKRSRSRTPRPYARETLELMHARWSKLVKDVYRRKRDTFDVSKVPDIYDCIKYDAMHNSMLEPVRTYMDDIHALAKNLADLVIPQEYGITSVEKFDIGSRIAHRLLRKITRDIAHATADPHEEDGSGILESVPDETVHRLDLSGTKLRDMDIKSPGRHVRTRLYFTSESHLHSIFNVIRFAANIQRLNQSVDEASFPPPPPPPAGSPPPPSSRKTVAAAAAAAAPVQAPAAAVAPTLAAQDSLVVSATSPPRPGPIVTADTRKGQEAGRMTPVKIPSPMALGHTSSRTSATSAASLVGTQSKRRRTPTPGLTGALLPELTPAVQSKVQAVSEFNYLTHVVFKVYEILRDRDDEDAGAKAAAAAAAAAGSNTSTTGTLSVNTSTSTAGAGSASDTSSICSSTNKRKRRFRVTVLFSPGIPTWEALEHKPGASTTTTTPATTPTPAAAAAAGGKGESKKGGGDDDAASLLHLSERFELYNLSLEQLTELLGTKIQYSLLGTGGGGKSSSALNKLTGHGSTAKDASGGAGQGGGIASAAHDSEDEEDDDDDLPKKSGRQELEDHLDAMPMPDNATSRMHTRDHGSGGNMGAWDDVVDRDSPTSPRSQQQQQQQQQDGDADLNMPHAGHVQRAGAFQHTGSRYDSFTELQIRRATSTADLAGKDKTVTETSAEAAGGTK